MAMTREEWLARTEHAQRPLTWPVEHALHGLAGGPVEHGEYVPPSEQERESALRAARARAIAAVDANAPKHWDGCDGETITADGYCKTCGRRQ